MAQNQQTPFLLPPGRMVWGDLYKPRTTDFEGRPLVYKSGPDQGKPRSSIDFGVAIPKVPGQHWASSEWGKLIWAAGHSGLANAGQNPDFAWKITDGDDARVPPLKPGKPQGKAPNQRPGYPGCWILSLSSSFAPQIVNGVDGSFAPITQPDAVKPGDYIQVRGNVQFNNSVGNPGVYLNHEVVCFSGYHPDGRITTGGIDAASVGFQTGAVPGAQMAPAGQAVPAPAAPPAAAPTYAPPPVPGAAAAPAYAPPPAAPTVVTPNPSFTPPPPVTPPVPAASPARVMLPAAGGVPYEEFIKAGWTDAQLIQHGKMAG